jgi:raffinose/stachyose/melibiose transport system permease protein
VTPAFREPATAALVERDPQLVTRWRSVDPAQVPVARRLRKMVEVAALLTPALILYLLFVMLPVVQAVYYSLFHWNGLEPLNRFIGLANYQRALGDPVFRLALSHNAIIVGLSIAVQLPLGLSLALLLNRRLLGRSALRMVIFAPYVLSEVVTGVAGLLMLQPGGLVDRVFQGLGLGHLVRLWVGDPNVVLYTLFVVVTWKYIGFAVILFLAGLQGS